MIEGVSFYWISWLFIICIVFFMEKGRRRSYYLYWILLTVLFANHYIVLGAYTVHSSLIILITGSFMLMASSNKKFLLIFIVLTIMLGYTSLLLFENSIPIWFLKFNSIIRVALMTILISILTKTFYYRMVSGILGMCLGKLVYQLIMINYNPYTSIEILNFFDLLSGTVFCCFMLLQYKRLQKWIASLKLSSLH